MLHFSVLCQPALDGRFPEALYIIGHYGYYGTSSNIDREGYPSYPPEIAKLTRQDSRDFWSSYIKHKKLKQPLFLPLSPEELVNLGWERPDILLVSGDAYVDHPSFGPALLGRWLVEHGFRVAILPQPRWEGQSALDDFGRLPRPRLFAGVTAGAIDSMLAHHTAFRKKRNDDAFTPGGTSGARPNRASIVYTGLLRRVFPGLPIVLGGLEASLRRMSHYDFWTDQLRRSILLDSKADLILCGMAEQALLQAAQIADDLVNTTNTEELDRKAFASACRHLPGAVTVLSTKEIQALTKQKCCHLIQLPSHAEIEQEPYKLLQATLELEKQVHQGKNHLYQICGDRALLLAPLEFSVQSESPEKFMDSLYALPFSRLPHPSYTQPIPAWEMIRTSITTHRGCGGGCSFCSLALHQGRRLSSRSRASILSEAANIAAGPGAKSTGKSQSIPPKWAGSISDVGGPSANMWQGRCTLNSEQCARASCLFPHICPGFEVDQSRAVKLLREIKSLPGVRHLRVASGVRFDLALQDAEALKAYCVEFTGGQLKIAPEHICATVLRHMRKPLLEFFENFLQAFDCHSRQAGKEQYVIPYLISAFPGCTDEHMLTLKKWLRKRGWSPQQVQCFIPTPGTVATAMFYCGRDTDGNPIPVAHSDRDRLRQHHILID